MCSVYDGKCKVKTEFPKFLNFMRHRFLTRILKIGVKNAVCQKNLEFYHTFLLALLKKLESESESWSKIILIWS